MNQNFSPEHRDLSERLKREGHHHVLRWVGELSESERAALFSQLTELDFERLKELGELIQKPSKPPSFEEIKPAPVERLPRTDAERQRDKGVCALGRKALQDDRVAALVVAGGQGTRLKFDGPKGALPITPVLKKPLFEVLAEKVLAARRNYKCRMPLVVMTSRTNDAQTRKFFAEKDFFGLGADTIHFFTQSDNPILDGNGRLLLEEKGRLLVGPDGHGGVFEALQRSGLAQDLLKKGLDLISYFQVDNPLVTAADERFIGHHLAKGAEFSCKVVSKRNASEGLGVAVLNAGKPAIVEYIDLPPEVASELGTSGELKYLYGSIAIHIINTRFAAQLGSGVTRLAWHVARKQYRTIGEGGLKAAAPQGHSYKFERFVFDCLSHAKECAFVEVDRESEFAPVKNAEGQDSPATAQAMMRNLWLRWLREAGADTKPLEQGNVPIEISPLYASSAEELKEKLPKDWRAARQAVL